MRGYQYHPHFQVRKLGPTERLRHLLKDTQARKWESWDTNTHILAPQPVLLSTTGTINRTQIKVLLCWWQQRKTGSPFPSPLQDYRKQTGVSMIHHYLLFIGMDQKSDMTYWCKAGIKILVSEVICGYYYHVTPKDYKVVGSAPIWGKILFFSF